MKNSVDKINIKLNKADRRINEQEEKPQKTGRMQSREIMKQNIFEET